MVQPLDAIRYMLLYFYKYLFSWLCIINMQKLNSIAMEAVLQYGVSYVMGKTDPENPPVPFMIEDVEAEPAVAKKK